MDETAPGPDVVYNHQDLDNVTDSTIINNIEGDTTFEFYGERLRSSKIARDELEAEVANLFVAPERSGAPGCSI